MTLLPGPLPALPYISRKEVGSLAPSFILVNRRSVSAHVFSKTGHGLHRLGHNTPSKEGCTSRQLENIPSDLIETQNQSQTEALTHIPAQAPTRKVCLLRLKERQGVLREQGHSIVRALLEKSPEHLLKSRNAPVRPAVAAAHQTRWAVPTGTSPAISFRTLASL